MSFSDFTGLVIQLKEVSGRLKRNQVIPNREVIARLTLAAVDFSVHLALFLPGSP